MKWPGPSIFQMVTAAMTQNALVKWPSPVPIVLSHWPSQHLREHRYQTLHAPQSCRQSTISMGLPHSGQTCFSTARPKLANRPLLLANIVVPFGGILLILQENAFPCTARASPAVRQNHDGIISRSTEVGSCSPTLTHTDSNADIFVFLQHISTRTPSCQ